MGNLALLLLLGLLACLWAEAMRARERALDACRRACRAQGFQLLDATVALSAIGLDSARGLKIRRVYRFSFSPDGYGRYGGTLTTIGADVQGIFFAPTSPP